MELSDFFKWLDNYLNFEKTQAKNIFWLESMKFLCEKLGNPQDLIPCIHVAGSKGKGSVSAMLASIIRESGHTCGIYSSPHITDFRERITSADGFFEDSIYKEAADILTKLVDSIPLEELPAKRPLTWFELVTVYAFLCFKIAKVDYVIYEVGLGGRLDSTNVVKPLASVLMPIELEHTEFLGDTIEKIAGEKAGIIKPETKAIVSFQNYSDAERVFEKKAKELKAPIIFVKNKIQNLQLNFTEKGLMQLSITSDNSNIKTELKLLGKVQAQNAATAFVTIKNTLPFITDKQIEQGLSKAFLPGRFEIFNSNIILDGAHTVKSISNTLDTMKNLFPNKKYHLLFACAGDKDIEDIIPLFKDIFQTITFTQPLTVRHCDAEKNLAIATKNGINAQLESELKKAYITLKSSLKNDDILLVTGSFYLVSEVKQIEG